MSNKKNEKPLYDEWGDPIKTRKAKPQAEPLLDEWGDPVKRIRVQGSALKQHQSEQDKLKLEKELVERGLIFPRAHYMPKAKLRGVVALVLAFLFGMLVVVGGILGAGIWVGTSMEVGDILGFVWSEEDYSKYLSEEYSKLKIPEFVQELMENEFSSLEDLSAVSPAVDGIVTQLLTGEGDYGFIPFCLADYGVLADKAKLMNTPFEGLGAYFADEVVPGIELAGLLSAFGINLEDPILRAICYGEEGVDFDVVDGEIFMRGEATPTTIGTLMNGFDGVLKNISLGTLLQLNSGNITADTVENNAAMYALAYGAYGIDYAIVNGEIVMNEGKKATTVGDLMGAASSFLENLDLGALLGLSVNATEQKIADNGVMYALAYGARGTDWEVTAKGTVAMLGARAATTIGQLMKNSTSLIKGMELESLMGVPDPSADEIIYYVLYGSKDRYTVHADGSITMNTDPNTGMPYPKRTVNDLMEDSLLDGMKISDIFNTAGASSLLSAISGWYVTDLSNAEKLEQLKIGDILGESDSSLVEAIAGMTIGDLKQDGALDGLNIGEVLGVTNEDSQLMQAIADMSIADLKKNGALDDITIGKLLGEGGNSGILQALKDFTLGDLKEQETFNNLEIGKVLGIENATGFMGAIADWSIGDLTDQSKIESLTLGAVMTLEGEVPPILNALKDTEIGKLSEKVDTLRLGEIMDATAIDSNKILKHLKDSTLNTLSQDIGTLTIGKVFEDEIYSYMEVKSGITYQALYNAYFGDHHGTPGYLIDGCGNNPDAIPQAIANDIVVQSRPVENGSGEMEFYYMNGTQEVKLERYLSGFWYLMLRGDDALNTPVLELDSLLPDTSHAMQDTNLASLWFFGVLTECPYLEFDVAITFGHGTPGSAGFYTSTVTNLNEVAISEMVALIKALTDPII
ncbi:MAG: hypothetical protein IKD43_03210 [Clostridia bacterium]|nr:hypothetical protein [Clostridia bacterium]